MAGALLPRARPGRRQSLSFDRQWDAVMRTLEKRTGVSKPKGVEAAASSGDADRFAGMSREERIAAKRSV